MSHFKKNLDEHYNYFSMLYEVRLSEYLSKKNDIRFVAASDLFTLNYYKQVLANTNDDEFNMRLAQVENNLLSKLQEIQQTLRAKYKTDDFQALKAKKKSDPNFQEQLKEDRVNLVGILNQSDILSALQQSLSKSLAMNIGKVNPTLMTAQDRQDAAFELALDFMGMGNTSIATFMDYLIDFDFIRNGKPQTITDLIKQLNFSALNYYRSQIDKKTVSTEESLKGGKADSRDVTREETLEAPEEKSMAEVTEEAYQGELKSITQFIRILNALGYTELKDALRDDFIKKKTLFDNRDTLTPDQIKEYNNVSNNIKSNIDRAIGAVNASNQSDIVKSDFNTLASQVTNALFIPGLGVESVEEILEEPQAPGATEVPRAGSASLAVFQDKARRNYNSLRSHMIDSTRFLHKKANPYFPYLAGVKTDDQREASKTGDVGAMIESGMTLVDAFKVKLMDIVNDWDIRHKWESTGNKLSDTDKSKNANDEYLKDLRNLASQPPFADENGNIRPEIMQLIATVVPPRTGSIDIPKASSIWQYMQQGFDVARINAELTRMLSNLGVTSFAELRGRENSPEVNAEIDKIVSEESHFGSHVGLPGEETQHAAYLPYSKPDPNNPGKYLQHNKLYFSFNPENFKNYLRQIIINYAANAEKLEKSKVSPPPGGAIPDPGVFGITLQKRKKPKTDAAESTQLGNQDESDTSSYAFGIDDQDSTIIPVQYFAYEAMEKPKKVRRFKIVVK